MINWSKYFDKIICINFNEFTTRRELLEFELERVGILNSGIFEWQFTFNGPYEKLFGQMLKEKYINFTAARVSCILGHINAVKKAYYTNCKNVLIIQDDERFLKDLNRIEQILEKLPEGYDLILLDKFINGYNNANKILNNQNNIINEEFIDIKDGSVFNAGCYILNRKGMELIISMIDMGFYCTFDMLFNFNQFKNVAKRAVSKESVSVQMTFSKGQTCMVSDDDRTMETRAYDFQKGYKYININWDNYMMRKDGSPFYYGDYIEE